MKQNKLIRLSKSCLSNTEKKAVSGVLDRENLGMGQEVKQFEDALSDFFSRSTVCVSTGTSALHLAVQACGIALGDEVLVPSLTYISCFQAISATGAKPVACDIDLKTLCLDWKDAEKRLTANTKAIMPVHYSGGVGDLDAIYDFANKYKLRVIEDAAHAFGSIYNGKRVGSFGDIACFSFDGIKNITSGEGGCVVSHNEKILKRVRDSRLLGVEKDTEQRYSGNRSWDFDVSNQGWRCHMSNIMAAIGLEQLKRFPELSHKRRILAQYYDSLFKNHSQIELLEHDYELIVPHIYVVRIKGMTNRENIQKKLKQQGIETGYHYQPNHHLSMYSNSSEKLFSVTDSVFPELITLPLHPDLLLEDLEYVSSSLKELLV
jgi:dTDP-4-amino-4,6-dideoxygalactose transaminase